MLETSASLTQDFTSLKAVCAHFNALHVYAAVNGCEGEGKDGRDMGGGGWSLLYMHLSADLSGFFPLGDEIWRRVWWVGGSKERLGGGVGI